MKKSSNVKKEPKIKTNKILKNDPAINVNTPLAWIISLNIWRVIANVKELKEITQNRHAEKRINVKI